MHPISSILPTPLRIAQLINLEALYMLDEDLLILMDISIIAMNYRRIRLL